VRKTEIPHLQTFGQAMAIRGKQLVTTISDGVASIIATAYAQAGGTPIFMNNDNYERYTEQHPVVVFTDTKYQQQLNDRAPHWRTANWLVIHNPKATEEVGAFLTTLLEEFGTPIPASS
jgi:hypothetical protein